MPAAFVIICRKRIATKSCLAPPVPKIKIRKKQLQHRQQQQTNLAGVLDPAGSHQPSHQSHALRSISLIRLWDIDRRGVRASRQRYRFNESMRIASQIKRDRQQRLTRSIFGRTTVFRCHTISYRFLVLVRYLNDDRFIFLPHISTQSGLFISIHSGELILSTQYTNLLGAPSTIPLIDDPSNYFL